MNNIQIKAFINKIKKEKHGIIQQNRKLVAKTFVSGGSDSIINPDSFTKQKLFKSNGTIGVFPIGER